MHHLEWSFSNHLCNSNDWNRCRELRLVVEEGLVPFAGRDAYRYNGWTVGDRAGRGKRESLRRGCFPVQWEDEEASRKVGEERT